MPVSKKICITGLKHSGKSTTGRLTAGAMGLPFRDLDDMIEELHLADEGSRLSCRDIYRRSAEYFRTLELRAAEAAAVLPEVVLAAGGGAADNEAAMAVLCSAFNVVYIDEKEDILFERIIRGGLPAFLDKNDPEGSFHGIYLRRAGIYSACADITVKAEGLPAADICALIISSIKENGNARKQLR